MKIEIEITSCKQCPHFKQERYYTEDSWEPYKKAEVIKIQGCVELYDENKVEIPEWCPYKPQKKEVKEILTVKKYKL